MPDELPTRIKMQSGGRIVVPDQMREELGLKKDSILEAKSNHKNQIVLTVLMK